MSILKDIFNFIVSSWDVTEYFIVNWLIVGVIGPFAYMKAFRLTGELANEFGRVAILMKIIHWTIRLGIYFSVVWILKGAIFVISFPITVIGVNSPRFWSSIIAGIVLLLISAKTKSESNMNNKLFWK